jgi:hypothetical protein
MLQALLIPWLLVPLGALADEPSATSQVTVRGVPLTVTRELELQAGLRYAPYGAMSMPLSGSFLLDAADARRDMGAMADLTLGADPLGPDASAALRGLELYRRDRSDPLELRVGRLSIARGGRFRFVDGADVAYHMGPDLTLAGWGGAAWHPERSAIGSGGATWGFDLAHRSAKPMGAALRYEHLAAEEGGGVERIGADASLHLASLAGLRVVARADAVIQDDPVELASLGAELRPHHRLHMRLDTGYSHPTADSLGRGGALGDLFQDGPSSFADAMIRVSLERCVLTADMGGLLLADSTSGTDLGWRAAFSRSGHAGRPYEHVLRLSGLGGPSGTATALLAEVGRPIGPMQVSVLGEQALFRFTEQSWRGMTVLGTRASTSAGEAWRLSLLGQVSIGQGPAPEAEVYLVATQQLTRGRLRKPAPTRERFLSPYSPWPWSEDDMPRSPGTAPGSDPYPSVPMPPEDDDAS